MLSKELGIPVLQLDDFRLMLRDTVDRALEARSVEPLVWDQLGLGGLRDVKEVYANPSASTERRFEALKATASEMSDAVEIVIAHHIATHTPVILEGDGLLPSLLTRDAVAGLLLEPGQLRGVFLVEDDEQRLHENVQYRGRGFAEGPREEQEKIVRASWLFGQWLKFEALKGKIPVLAPCPFETLSERASAALGIVF